MNGFFTIITVLTACISFGEEPLSDSEKKCNTAITELDEAALDAWGENRAAGSNTLLAVLANGDQKSKEAAIFLLGAYHYENTTHIIARHIEMESQRDKVQKRKPRWGRYPAVEALIRMGKPSVRHMMKILKETEDEHRRALAARVIFYIEGEDIGRFIIDQAIANANSEAKKHFERARELIRGGEYIRPVKIEASSTASAGKGEWSEVVNGLQGRLVLSEKPKRNGAHWLVPHLELRNVRDLANAMDVDCGSRRLNLQLVDKEGKLLRSGQGLRRSGPVPDLSTVVLPYDSSMRISLECRNWGIPRNAAAMLQSDSGAWIISEVERGKVFLTATLTGEIGRPRWKTWHGDLKFPLVPVDWDAVGWDDTKPD